MARKKASPAPPWASDPQYLAFESDLTANPDDDTPRLVLADWLEEHGDDQAAARAEFIRLQIEMERLDESDPRRTELQRRESDLLNQYQQIWLGSLGGIVTEAVWKRGFPQRLKLGARAFMDNADQLFRQAPILHLQLLRINQTKMTMEELAASPHFARLRGLSLPSSGIGDQKLSTFLSKADLKNLELLELPNAGVGEDTLATIAQAQLPRLRELNLTGNYYFEFSAQQLFNDKVLFRLKRFEIGSTPLNANDFAVMLRWRGLEEVEHLDVHLVRLGNEGARELAGTVGLKHLKSLNLNGCEIGTRGIQMIADAGALPTLQSIDLTSNNLRPAGLQSLLRCSFADRLTTLNLSNNLLTDGALEILADWPGLSKIKVLKLSYNEITSTGIETLFTSPHLGELTRLVLTQNPEIGDDGARMLAECPKLAHLEQLELMHCGIGNPGADAILASPRLTKLKRFGAEMNLISKATMKRLSERFPTQSKYPGVSLFY